MCLLSISGGHKEEKAEVINKQMNDLVLQFDPKPMQIDKREIEEFLTKGIYLSSINNHMKQNSFSLTQ